MMGVKHYKCSRHSHKTFKFQALNRVSTKMEVLFVCLFVCFFKYISTENSLTLEIVSVQAE